MPQNLHLYSIMPLNIDHADEICEDIKRQYEMGVASCALFSMTLTPEGNPPVDKVGIMCEKFDVFKKKLNAMGISCGVLVQASIGHGYPLGELFPFQRYVGIETGKETFTVCPYDEGFRDHIYSVMRTIAQHEPDCIMVDDDFRLMARSTKGCGCPLHMKRFNELAGTNMSREELWDVLSADENRELVDIYVSTQGESLIDTAKAMRAGIDSVNPKLPGSFCCCGGNAEFAGEIAQILAGDGNPVVVRINNGRYTSPGPRGSSMSFQRAARQIEKLKDKVDVILAETDTCPQNRYSTAAMSLHTHFTGTILEGAKGAKHWITRLASFEPESGKAYRKVLGRNRGFYEALAEIVPTLKWRGCRIPVTKKPNFTFKAGTDASNTSNAWIDRVFEVMGLPVYFSGDTTGAACFEGDIDKMFTDEEIMEMLKGPMFLASDSAKRLIDRGFGEYLGVDVREWNGKMPRMEKLLVNGETTKAQMQIKELVPTSEDTVIDSEVLFTLDNKNYEYLFPGTTIYKNSLGGIVFTFAGTPKAVYNYVEAFSFLSYSRKQQLIRMLSMTDELPIYFPGDEEVYLRAADMADGGMFCAVFNLGLDPIDELELVCGRELKTIEKLMPNGEKSALSFHKENEKYIINTNCMTLDPVVLIIH